MSQDVQNDDMNAGAAVTAVMLGVGDGISQVIKDKGDQASQLITPGDQHHIAHPIDDTFADISGVWQTLTTPADMNIKHSVHPVAALNDAHDALVSATADNFSEKGLEQGLRDFSAFATVAVIETVDPFKKLNILENIADVANVADGEKVGKILQITNKVTPVPIDWNTYEHLLGYGSQPPKLKPLRDFSDLMHYQPREAFGETSRLIYEPDNGHKLFMYFGHHVDHEFPPNFQIVMDFLVRADGGLREHYGSGAEMFHSGMALLRRYDVTIDRIDGEWSRDGDLATNYLAFANARAQGATIKEAISQTSTGRWAADAGFTEVGGMYFDREMKAPNLPTQLHPQFTRPVFSEDQAYNTYGNAWANSQGRSRVDLHSRHDHAADKLPESEISPLAQQLQHLTQQQRDVCIECIRDNLNKQPGISIADIESELK